MRVAVVSESLLPQVNGVADSVLRVCEQMQRHGNPALVVASHAGPTSYADAHVAARLAGQEPARRRMGRAARLCVQHRTWDVIGDQMLGHCAQVAGGATGVAA